MPVTKKSTHKNASRSRHLIKQAFGELLNEKPLQKITVTDIVERANISRGTFYAHYLDVYDLYAAVQNNMLEMLDEEIDRLGIERIIGDPSDAVRFGMQFLSENKNYFALFIKSSYAEMFLDRAMRRIEDKYLPLINEQMPRDDIPVGLCFMTYTLGAYKNVLTQWFSGELELTGEECANYLIDFYLRSRPKEVLHFVRKINNETPEMIG
ncbi:MAG: TetR/AcrR family transcriptional regulator [Clostridia bacterium]|nr:TetR/AcrR family transcriptional regulator [Clostridia bacterium]